jgi:hypothetical protein
MAAARGPIRSDRVMAAVLGAFALVLGAVSLWAFVLGEIVPGLAFGAMTVMLGLGIFVLVGVRTRAMTPEESAAHAEWRDRNRMERMDHGGVDWGGGSGGAATTSGDSGSHDATSSSSSGDSGSSGATETGRST